MYLWIDRAIIETTTWKPQTNIFFGNTQLLGSIIDQIHPIHIENTANGDQKRGNGSFKKSSKNQLFGREK